MQAMYSDLRDSSSTGAHLQVMLDGTPVCLPAERRTLAAIRSYLETLALERQRILYSFRVDGRPASLAEPLQTRKPFARVDARSVDPAQMPLQLVRTALHQTVQAQRQILAAVTVVMLNDCERNSEFWWNLAQDLKQPLLTLSLLPDTLWGPAPGGASLSQLRKWQLQQLAAIIKEVDETCWLEDPTSLSDALETRVLPWLHNLQRSLELWHETLSLAEQVCPTSALPPASLAPGAA